MSVRGSARGAGFTLIELLVAIAVIAILISLLVPALAGARHTSQRIHCENNHRSLMQACHLYANAWQDRMPLPNWLSMDKYAGWLYAPPAPPVWKWETHRTGALWQYLEKDQTYRCIAHRDDFKGSAFTTSYLLNGALVGFGANSKRTASFRVDQFRPDAIMFWEVEFEGWNDGSSYPTEGLNSRHGKQNVRTTGKPGDPKLFNKGASGNTVSCIDGHTEWMTHIEYKVEMDKRPSRLWCSPGSPTGDS